MAATAQRVRDILATLRRRGSRRNVEGMARYGIVAKKSFGVSVETLRQLGKRYGRDHALAVALWNTGWYEARMLAAFVDEPGRVTPAQMDRWTRAFDNWAICDTLCFHLFDRTPYVWPKIRAWSRQREEFVKRAGFALLASAALHDRETGDAPFAKSLALIERGASDERNFVKKGVSWALRSVGSRSPALHRASVAMARRLADAPDPAARWVGRDALRDLSRPMVLKRAEARAAKRR